MNAQEIIRRGDLYHLDVHGRWLKGVAVLTQQALLLTFPPSLSQPTFQLRQVYFDMAKCRRVESVRGTAVVLQDEGVSLQVFVLTVEGGREERLACAKATQRVSWLSSILCARAPFPHLSTHFTHARRGRE